MSIGKLVSVAAVAPLQLVLRWDDDVTDRVDLSAIVTSRTALRPLMDATVFGSVRLAGDGWSIEWPSAGIDFGAAQLRRWSDEEGGQAMPAAAE